MAAELEDGGSCYGAVVSVEARVLLLSTPGIFREHQDVVQFAGLQIRKRNGW